MIARMIHIMEADIGVRKVAPVVIAQAVRHRQIVKVAPGADKMVLAIIVVLKIVSVHLEVFVIMEVVIVVIAEVSLNVPLGRSV